MAIPKKYEHIDFVPPKGAQEAAKKVLKWKKEYPDEVTAMTSVGWARARQLAEGKVLSPDIVKRMSNFARHKKNSEIDKKHKGKPWMDNGYVAWCLSGDTEILLADGTCKTIKEICDNKLTIEVMSYDQEKDIIKPSKIINWHVNSSNVNDFYCLGKIKQNRTGVSKKTYLKITKEHPVLTERGWKNYEEILDSDNIATVKQWFNDDIEQIIFGTLLGDSYVGKDGRIIFSHGLLQKEYALEKAKLLNVSPPSIRTQYSGNTSFAPGSKQIMVRTQVKNYFKKLRHILYQREGKRMNFLFDNLNEIGLAFWIMDDGSLHYNKSKNISYYYRIHTEGWIYEDIKLAIKWLNRKKISCKIAKRNDCNKYFIRVNTEGSKKLADLIAPYICDCMLYKLPQPLRKRKYLLSNETFNEYKYSFQSINKKTKCNELSRSFRKLTKWDKKYNITVENTHTYIANGFIVHNCGWGSDVGIEWAKRKVKEMERADNKKLAYELIRIAEDINFTIKEECENWVRDFLQKYKSVNEAVLMRRGGRYFGKDVLKKCLKEMKEDEFLDKKGNNWIWMG